MFSSAQVEYIRYWLHAMGLTKNLLPLPSSDYLLTETESLRNCTSVFFNDPRELKKAVAVCLISAERRYTYDHLNRTYRKTTNVLKVPTPP